MVVPLLRQLFSGLSLWWHRFNPRPVHVEMVVDNMSHTQQQWEVTNYSCEIK